MIEKTCVASFEKAARSSYLEAPRRLDTSLPLRALNLADISPVHPEVLPEEFEPFYVDHTEEIQSNGVAGVSPKVVCHR
jgi:hypothetical protein